MLDKTDFIIREYPCKQRKNGLSKTKLYRSICDVCGKKLSYTSSSKDNRHYCRECHYRRLSKLFSVEKIKIKCATCGKEIERTKSQFERSKNHFCSNECLGIFKRKDIAEVSRSQLRIKVYQSGVAPICSNCGHDHTWNMQVHHKIFVIDGGVNELENLIILCRNCHADIHCERKDDE
jgi:5-methylcytosine-specific restriction endonuclease McrA